MKKIFTFIVVMVCGLCTVMAQLPYNTTVAKSHFDNASIVVAKESANWDSGIRLGTTSNWSPGNWNDHYVVIALNQGSIPYQLKYKYKVNFAISSNPNWYVEESADNSTWSRLWSNESRNTSWSDQQVLTLAKSTKYIKLCFSGNYSGTFADIIVTDQSYVHDPKVGDDVISSLDFGTGTISSGKAELSFDVEWCNVDELSVSCDNTDVFSVSPASFGSKAKYGTQTVTVGYNRNVEVNDHSGTITISNGSITKTVTVSGSTTKRNQDIHWNTDLVATSFTMNAEDALTGEEVATADNEEADVTFESEDEGIIAVSPDGKTLSAVANGTVTITVKATGNEIYSEATDSKVFTVTSDKKQVITWEQNFMSLKTDASPNTIDLEATSTSGGVITYALEDGSDACVTLSGENNATMTITGSPGVAYIIATQAGGEINGEIWIAASARKQVKVRDPQSACDEYALSDKSFTFAKGDKTTMAEQEYALVGKPTQLTFTAKWGGKKYAWSEQQDMIIEQYANFGSGLEWKQITSFLMTTSNASYGPFAIDETATKIRFRSGEYGEQSVSNISIPRKKELVVSESAIEENGERNVRWSKTISVSRSNIDVVDISVESDDTDCKFEVSKNSIGTDCADRSTETFEVSITPHEKNKTYTGIITITDGKATPTTHTISLAITAIGFNQTLSGFSLPATCLTTDVVEMPQVTVNTGLEPVIFLSSDSAIAYVEKNALKILKAGSVDIIAYQEGDDRYNEVSETKTIDIQLAPSTILQAPEATMIAIGSTLSTSKLRNGQGDVEGTFVWANGDEILATEGDFEREVIFVPSADTIYATASVNVTVSVVDGAVILEDPTISDIVYGQELGEAVITDGVATVSGTFTLTSDPTDVYDAGDWDIYMVFTPDDPSYDEVPLTITLHVEQAEPEIYTYPTATDVEEGQTLAESLLDGGEASENGYFDWADNMIEPIVGTHDYEVLFVPDDANYKAVSIWVSVRVNGTTTSLNEVETEAAATKFLRNGVIYIQRNGNTYSVQGKKME